MKYTILLLLYSCAAWGQPDTLNKRNSWGMKHGYWKVYLDEKATRTNKKDNAYFYGLDFYDNGYAVFKYYKPKWKKKLRFVYEGVPPTKGNPIVIKGKFLWYDNTNKICSEEVYDNGQPVYVKSFGCNNNKVTETLDFTKRYNNIPGTFYHEQDLNSCSEIKITKYWYRKGDAGWKSYPIDNQ